MKIKRIYYALENKFNYFIAKHFGIAQYYGTYVKAESTYVYDRELDDDRYIYYEKVYGLQLFPFNKKWLSKVSIEFGEDSRYRGYIEKKIKEKTK